MELQKLSNKIFIKILFIIIPSHTQRLVKRRFTNAPVKCARFNPREEGSFRKIRYWHKTNGILVFFYMKTMLPLLMFVQVATSSQAMILPVHDAFALKCADGYSVNIPRALLRLSPFFETFYETVDPETSGESLPVLELTHPFAIWGFVDPMIATANHVIENFPNGENTQFNDVKNLILETAEMIEKKMRIEKMPPDTRNNHLKSLLIVVEYLQLRFLPQAIACLAVKYECFKPTLEQNMRSFFGIAPPDDMHAGLHALVKQAEAFLRTDFNRDVVELNFVDELCGWGLLLVPTIPDSSTLFANHVNALIEEKNFANLHNLMLTLKKHKFTMHVDVLQHLFTSYIRNCVSTIFETFDAAPLQATLENFMKDGQAELAELAYGSLFAELSGRQKDDLVAAFAQLQEESAVKIGVRYVLLDKNVVVDHDFRRRDLTTLVKRGVSLHYILPIVAQYKLKTLKLICLNLTSIPREIGLLTELKSITLGDNRLTDLPQEIALCRQLSNVELFRNNFSEFPQPLLDLKELKILDLTGNHLAALPDELGLLPKLETISMDRITIIPVSFKYLNITYKLWDVNLHRWM